MNSKKINHFNYEKTILSITIALAAGANGHAQATNDHVNENKPTAPNCAATTTACCSVAKR